MSSIQQRMQKLREQLREESAPPNVLSRNEAAARLEQKLRTEPGTKQDMETEPAFDHVVFSSFLNSHDEDMKTLKQAVSEENLDRIVAGLLEDRVKKVVERLIVDKIGPVLKACAESVDQSNLAFEKLQKEFIVVREAQDKRLDTMQAALDALTSQVGIIAPDGREVFDKLLSDSVTKVAENQTKMDELFSGYDKVFREQAVELEKLLTTTSEKFAKTFERMDSAVATNSEKEKTRDDEFQGKLVAWQTVVDGAKESVVGVVSALGTQLEDLTKDVGLLGKELKDLTKDVDLLALEPLNMGYLCQKIQRSNFLPVMARINALNPGSTPLSGMAIKRLCMSMIEKPPKYDADMQARLINEGPDVLTPEQILAGIPRTQNLQDLKETFKDSKFDTESPLFFSTLVKLAGHLKNIFTLPASATP